MIKFLDITYFSSVVPYFYCACMQLLDTLFAFLTTYDVVKMQLSSRDIQKEWNISEVRKELQKLAFHDSSKNTGFAKYFEQKHIKKRRHKGREWRNNVTAIIETCWNHMLKIK